MKVALVYDRVNKFGGAERVLLALHEIFPNAPLYTSVYHPEKASWAKAFDVHTSFLQKIPFARRRHDLFAPLMPFVFESFHFDTYDLVISVTSEAAKGIKVTGKTKHVSISLTPTRYLWSGYHEYFKNRWLKFFSYPAVWYLRRWDRKAANRPLAHIAISQEVQRRIATYYGKKAAVIYPPMMLAGKRKKTTQKGYFLVVSRLVPYKRIDIAIEVCNRLKLPLKIIGTGSEEDKLRKIAGPTVELLGNLTDQEVVEYYNGCCAFIFPGCEDLGLTILEAQYFGKPVIAFKAGGALETIIEGRTGEFFYPQKASALKKKLQMLIESKKINIHKADQIRYKAACIRQANRFGKAQFRKKLLQFIDTHI